MKKDRKALYKKFYRQKLIGVLLIVIAVIMVQMCSSAQTLEQADCARAVLVAPLGLYLLFTRHIVIT